jgi:Predicted transcriptional regulators
MDIVISSSDIRPLYEQIISQIKKRIIQNDLKEGDSLPSMRLLAKELRISVITTKRAYTELERQGYIETITGKGSFVAKKNIQIIYEEQLKEIESCFQKGIDIARQTGLTLSELEQMLENLYEGE